LLKEDLTWNGSPMVVMNRKEAAYLQAMQDYLKGSPSMPDTEFDQLKADLMEEGSKFAVQTEPKCYIDTGICKVTLQEDKFRSNLLYLPAGSLLFLAWVGIGFEIIEPIVRLNPIVLILLGTPLIYTGSKKITEEYIFQNKFLAYGPCPSCQAENRVYFGDILGVEGFSDLAQVKCPNCKTQFSVQRATLRASTLPK
jgi:Zn ribbon nucleic-acid-binding protein